MAINPVRKNLQFRRNDTILENSAAARARVWAHANEFYDGEQVFCRYWAYKKGTFALDANKRKQLYAATPVSAYLATYVDATYYTVVSGGTSYHLINSKKEYLQSDLATKYQLSAATLIALIESNDESGSTREISITFDDPYTLAESSGDDIEEIKNGMIVDIEVSAFTQDIASSGYNDTNADLYGIVTTTAGGTSALTHTYQIKYTPYSSGTTTVPQSVGDIEAGTTAAALNKTNISKIIDNILFPTKYPIITTATSTLDFNVAPSSTLVKLGTQYNALKVTYNRGKSIINDNASNAKFYNGTYNSCTITTTFTAGTTSNTSIPNTYITNFIAPTFNTATATSTYNSTATNTMPVGYETAYMTATTTSNMNTIGTYMFASTVNYNAGDNLITSKSNPGPNPIRYESLDGVSNKTIAPYLTVVNPNPSNSISVGAKCEVNVTLPIFATTANTTNLEELTKLVKWGATADTISNDDENAWIVTFPDTSKSNPIKIASPRELASVNALNPSSNVFSAEFVNNFTRSTTTINVNGNNLTYYLYTWNGAVTASGKYKITWKS